MGHGKRWQTNTAKVSPEKEAFVPPCYAGKGRCLW